MCDEQTKDPLEEGGRTIEAATEAAAQEPRKRRRRRLTPAEGPMVKSVGTLEVRTVDLDGRVYCQRYVRCGKGCARCDGDSDQFDPERPGHGPYWYRIVRGGQGRTIRRYVGKTLPVEGGANK